MLPPVLPSPRSAQGLQLGHAEGCPLRPSVPWSEAERELGSGLDQHSSARGPSLEMRMCDRPVTVSWRTNDDMRLHDDY